MDPPPLSSWNLVRVAAGGDPSARSEFSQRFLPVVRAYLGARWRSSPLVDELDDAVQEVFLDCFKPHGALERVDPGTGASFRAFLFGVVRNVALRHETQRHRHERRISDGSFHESRHPDEEARLSRIFDRAWAQAIMAEAARLQSARAGAGGERAQRRVELLRLRFQDGLPIRDIAKEWDVDAAVLHHEYAEARKDFREVLREVVATHHCCPEEQLERECMELLTLLQ